MIYKPDKFELFELLPKKFYEENIHKGDNLWFIFDPKLLVAIDKLRKLFGKMYINTWYWGGKRDQSGFRINPIKASLSQHLFGRAADILFEHHDTESVRQWIIKNRIIEITGIELNVSWLHIDTRNYNGLFLFE